jgi:hypothetical protein
MRKLRPAVISYALKRVDRRLARAVYTQSFLKVFLKRLRREHVVC